MKRVRCACLAVALIGAVVLALDWYAEPTRAAYSWLVACVFVYTSACGALVLLMIGHATQAVWLVAFRRPLEAMVSVLPLIGVAFVPILLSLDHVYGWAPGGLSVDAREAAAIATRRAYLHPPFFVLRSAVYVILPTLAAELLIHFSRAQERAAEYFASRMRALSAAGLPFVFLAATFAGFDWMMSLEPAFRSTSFGAYLLSGGFLASLGILAVVTSIARRRDPIEPSGEHLHALGKVMLAAVAFWAYLAFTQYLIVWIADLPPESSFYLARMRGGWEAFVYLIMVARFAIPLAALLSRGLKRSAGLLALVGALVALMHWVELFWLALPTIRGAPDVSVADPTAMLVLLAAATALALFRSAGVAPLPGRDPLFLRSLRYRSE